ncbi:UDP-N-acetylmuramoyl-tripeptide--D-alanyl-D-alanine ligase, partial [Flavobacteriaceae bacterium (ex Bugula neritina AB1)]
MEIAKIHQLFLDSNGICTDTRKIKVNTLFFALKGDNFDGNQYAQQALDNGASYAVIDDKKVTLSKRHILVENVLKTLQDLASFHRKYIDIPILALTGSNGKTTTKELINQVLSSTYKTTATIGNLNNHIGVPLTLLSMTKDTEIGIVEMGANHLKEIENLCNIAFPDYGYITNIGKAHLEGFGSLEGVLKGKTELYRHLNKYDKLIFLNSEDKKLTNASEAAKTYTFSNSAKSDVMIQLESTNPMVHISYQDETIKSNLIGSYNFTNIAAAIAIGNYFKISFENIKNAIESYTPSNNRSQIITKNQLTIILDAYNANPSSMHAALDNFEKLTHDSKTVFLGDMFELGDNANIEHQGIVDSMANSSFNQIHLIGHHFYKTTIKDSRIQTYKTYDDFEQKWKQTMQLTNAVLI